MTSAAVGWEKPNPAIFEAALRRAGRPDAVFMVGDNPEADIAGAIRVGIPALLVRTPAAADGVTLDLHDAADRVLAGGT